MNRWPRRTCIDCGIPIVSAGPDVNREYRRMHTERRRIGSTFGAERRGHLKRMTRQLVMIDRRLIHDGRP